MRERSRISLSSWAWTGSPRSAPSPRLRRSAGGTVVLDHHGSRVHPVATTGSRTFCMRPITALRADGMPIGELSRRTGVNIETIRYYEKIEMLPAPARTAGGHRVYGPQQARILAFIPRRRQFR